jgi:hypothetical protein
VHQQWAGRRPTSEQERNRGKSGKFRVFNQVIVIFLSCRKTKEIDFINRDHIT